MQLAMDTEAVARQEPLPPPVAYQDPSWTCEACTFFNERVEQGSTVCEMCGTGRPPPPPVPDEALRATSDGAGMVQLQDDRPRVELFHINGLAKTVKGKLQGPQLVRLRVVKNDGTSMASFPSTGTGVRPIVDVLRTKWHGCDVEWVDGVEASIHG